MNPFPFDITGPMDTTIPGQLDELNQLSKGNPVISNKIEGNRYP